MKIGWRQPVTCEPTVGVSCALIRSWSHYDFHLFPNSFSKLGLAWRVNMLVCVSILDWRTSPNKVRLDWVWVRGEIFRVCVDHLWRRSARHGVDITRGLQTIMFLLFNDMVLWLHDHREPRYGEFYASLVQHQGTMIKHIELAQWTFRDGS